MRKVLVTIVGPDRPGIIHLVSRTLADYHCNVIEVTQTTLLGQFAGIFSCTLPDTVDLTSFYSGLGQALSGSDLAHWITEVEALAPSVLKAEDYEPYVVTVRGKDRPGLIPEYTGCMSGFDINVENLRTAALGDNPDTPLEEGGEHQVIMFFELSVPRSVNPGAFRQALSLITEEMNMEMCLQHRDIFEAIHRL